MKVLYQFLMPCLVFFSLPSKAQQLSQDEPIDPTAGTQISVHIPSPERETRQVWNTIRDIQFFNQHGYRVNLPKAQLIDSLVQYSQNGHLEEQHYRELETLMKSQIFNPQDYQKGYALTQHRLPFLRQLVAELDTTKFQWPFRKFPEYHIYLTLYGPGGSYDPDQGTITLYTTTNGQFKLYDDPANTIIHEIVHIGIETSIIQQYQVPHPLKERLVDTFVIRHFGDRLPQYRPQNFGDPAIDQQLTHKCDFQNLHQIVETFLAKK